MRSDDAPAVQQVPVSMHGSPVSPLQARHATAASAAQTSPAAQSTADASFDAIAARIAGELQVCCTVTHSLAQVHQELQTFTG